MSYASPELKMSAVYVSLGGRNATAIPWATIIQMIMSLMSGCTAKSAKRFASRHPDALETMLQNKLKDDTDLSPKDVKLVAKAGVNVFNGSTVKDVEEAMSA